MFLLPGVLSRSHSAGMMPRAIRNLERQGIMELVLITAPELVIGPIDGFCADDRRHLFDVLALLAGTPATSYGLCLSYEPDDEPVYFSGRFDLYGYDEKNPYALSSVTRHEPEGLGEHLASVSALGRAVLHTNGHPALISVSPGLVYASAQSSSEFLRLRRIVPPQDGSWPTSDPELDQALREVAGFIPDRHSAVIWAPNDHPVALTSSTRMAMNVLAEMCPRVLGFEEFSESKGAAVGLYRGQGIILLHGLSNHPGDHTEPTHAIYLLADPELKDPVVA